MALARRERQLRTHPGAEADDALPPTRASRRRQRESLHPAVWGGALYILVSVGRLQEIVPGLMSLPLGKVALLLGLGGLLVSSGRGRRVLDGPIARVLAALAVLALLSLSYSIWRSYSLDFLLGSFLSNLLLFYILTKSADNEATLRFYTGALILSGLLLALPSLQFWGTRAAVSQTYDPNDLAMVLVTILPLAAVHLIIAGGRRLLWLAVCLVFAVAVIATESRGGFLGLMAVGGYLVLVAVPGREAVTSGRLVRLTVITVVGGSLILLTSHAAWERIGTLLHLGNDYNLTASTGRVAVWERGLHIFAHHPWGVGIHAFEAAEGNLGGRYKAAHNSLIEIGAELGVVGLWLYLLLHLRAHRLLNRLQAVQMKLPGQEVARVVGLRGALIGFFVTSFFLSQAYAPVLCALLALTEALAAKFNVSLGRRQRERTAKRTGSLVPAPPHGRGVRGSAGAPLVQRRDERA